MADFFKKVVNFLVSFSSNRKATSNHTEMSSENGSVNLNGNNNIVNNNIKNNEYTEKIAKMQYEKYLSEEHLRKYYSNPIYYDFLAMTIYEIFYEKIYLQDIRKETKLDLSTFGIKGKIANIVVDSENGLNVLDVILCPYTPKTCVAEGCVALIANEKITLLGVLNTIRDVLIKNYNDKLLSELKKILTDDVFDFQKCCLRNNNS